MKETHYDGTRSGKNFTLDRQTEPLVMDSEISGLADKHAFLKLGNNVARFSFLYCDIPSIAPDFIARPLAGDELFRPKKPLPVVVETEVPPDTSQQTDGGPVTFALPFSPIIQSTEL
jgi:hypothetical protein